MDKIIIEVSGGVVNAVYSNNPTVDVRLLDWDVVDSQNMTSEQKQMQDEIKMMKEVL